MAGKPSPRGTWFIYRGKGGNRHSIGTKISRAQQDRLTRGGITYNDYKRGVSEKAARGHKNTPERKIEVSTATPEQRAKHPKYFARREGDLYIFSTDGIKGPFPRIQISLTDEKLIGGHWGKIGRALEGDVIAIMDIPSFKKAKKVGGYGTIPRLSLEYRMDEIERAAARGILPDKPFTIGSD